MKNKKMKHIKLFEGWGDTINRNKSKFILIERNHYLNQERSAGFYNSMDRALSSFLDKFKTFINVEWQGIPKDYFGEMYPEVMDCNTWEEFFANIKGNYEGRFYLESTQPSAKMTLDEVELLKNIYENKPSYLESVLPFSIEFVTVK